MRRKKNKHLFRLITLWLLCALLCSGCGMQEKSTAETNTVGTSTAETNTAEINTTKADTANANTVEANIAKANTVKADMAKANIVEVNLAEANLTEADTEYTSVAFAMGTYMKLTAYGEQAERALELSKDKIKELEALWSVTDENSDIYKVNHSDGRPIPISRETGEVLSFALNMAGETEGALEPTVFPIVTAWGFISGDYRIPDKEELEGLLQYVDYKKVSLEKNQVTLPERMELDLGAVGKGYTGDILSELLKEQGITSALLDIGGNIQMIGRKPDGSRWRLGIQNPFGEGSVGVLESGDGAVVTSGNYERYFIGEDGEQYGHIIDPSTGYPADSGLASVTIIAKEGKLCDALSTAVYVMGLEKGSEYWRETGSFEMLLVTDENEIYLTEGIEDDFSLSADFSHGEIHVIGK